MTDLTTSGHFSCGALEFPAIVEMLGHFLSGPLGKPALEAIQPCPGLAAAQREIAAAKEAGDYLLTASRPSLGGLHDPRSVLERLRVDSCSALEILAVVEVARAACDWRELFSNTSFAHLDALARRLPHLRDLVKDLSGKILPDGSIDSSASPALARIRRSIEQTRLELHSKLERIQRRLGQDEVLQDDLVTLRNGRFVLPVKVEKKRQVEGVVHGASSSGQSVFVEPLETLPLNNELVELEDREAEEIRRILDEYSGRLRECRQELLEAADLLSALDLAFAKAEFARHYDACFPEFSQGRDLVLREARHPLLVRALRAAGRDAVPLTLELRAPQTMVIISGPNTGGKTVALKTVGAAVLMAQAGLPVTAREARLPVFERVFADIGDQQSIEQNLSTFSAHIRNIQAMADAADGNTLVLLDEMGGSTDPEEGAALAIAILEHFRRRGAMALISTHHSRLKAFAAATPQALNAAMDFDEATLQPTYKFLCGLPGKSSGIDTAQRLGLDAGIVRQARELVGRTETEVGDLIASLHAKRDELEAGMAEARRQARDLDLREARLKHEMQAERQAKLKELDKRLEHTLREYGAKWQAALEEIRRAAPAGTKPAKAVARSFASAARRGERLARDTQDEWNVQVLETRDAPASPAETIPDLPAEVGDRVRLPGLSTPGVVTAVFENNQIEVEVGRVRIRVPRGGARVVARAGVTRSTETNSAVSPFTFPASAMDAAEGEDEENKMRQPGAEINVIGRTAEEACDRVDRFLDSAFLAGRRTIRIIHGHGKGILRKALHEMLATHPHVERFYPAARQEGGEGATIVEIKR
ncbi:MAG: endonuclease MutS2 [Terriglobia bacterium]